MEILGYIAAVFIGVILGLIGGGGSILTVPILVYLMSKEPVLATGYSLFVVGSTALVGALNYWRKDLVEVKTGLVFALPSVAAVFTTRKFVVPAIPKELFSIGDFTMTKNMGMMVLFALIMLGSAYSMLKKNKGEEQEENEEESPNYFIVMLQGLLIGALTGMVGAGGGFLIVPALVLLVGLPMKKAVATSLLVIAINSLLGFLGDVTEQKIEWGFLLSFASLAIGGIFIGIFLSRFVSGEKLKKGFGWFVALMGIFILVKELAFS
jgi:uncharacterized protein